MQIRLGTSRLESARTAGGAVHARRHPPPPGGPAGAPGAPPSPSAALPGPREPGAGGAGPAVGRPEEVRRLTLKLRQHTPGVSLGGVFPRRARARARPARWADGAPASPGLLVRLAASRRRRSGVSSLTVRLRLEAPATTRVQYGRRGRDPNYLASITAGGAKDDRC